MTEAMSAEQAGYILRRKPILKVDYDVSRVALLVLKASGMDQASVEREVMREMSYPEMLVMEGF